MCDERRVGFEWTGRWERTCREWEPQGANEYGGGGGGGGGG